MASGGSAPKEPDYTGAAREQGRQNILAARENARLNRVGTTGPYGSTSWTGDDTKGWTLNTQLNPNQQSLVDSSAANANQGNILAGQALTRYGSTAGTGLDRSGYNARTTSIANPSLQKNVTSPGVSQMSIDTNGLAALPGANDYSADRQRVEDTIYNQSLKTLDPQWQKQEDAMRTRLLNSGVREGSDAWGQAWDEFSRGRTAAYGDARDRSIINAGGEQSRMLNDASNIRAQQFGERTTSSQFANDASAQQLDAELARLGFFNNASGQEFDQAMQNANLGNSQRDAQFGEDATARSMQLEELMSLIGLNQGPQGTPANANASGGQGIEPVDTMGALQNQYGAQMNRYNNRVASANSTNQSAAAVGAALIAAFSDRRLKRDIQRIGTLPNGLPVYSFRYLWDDAVHRGVMADEVRAVMPAAVHTHESGYDMVDYAAINAVHLLEAA